MVNVCTSLHRGNTITVQSGLRRASPRNRIKEVEAITQRPPKGAGAPSLISQALE